MAARDALLVACGFFRAEEGAASMSPRTEDRVGFGGPESPSAGGLLGKMVPETSVMLSAPWRWE